MDSIEERFQNLLRDIDGPTPTNEAPFALEEEEQKESEQNNETINNTVAAIDSALPNLNSVPSIDPKLVAARKEARSILQLARKDCHSGWLLKKGPKGDPQRRYCSLRHQILLYYVQQQQEDPRAPKADPKGALPLHGSTIQKSKPLKGPVVHKGILTSLKNLLATHILSEHRLRLTLKNGTIFEWSADTQELRDKWYSAFIKYGKCLDGIAYDIEGSEFTVSGSERGGASNEQTAVPPLLSIETKRQSMLTSSLAVQDSSDTTGNTPEKEAKANFFVEIEDGGWVDVEGTKEPPLPVRSSITATVNSGETNETKVETKVNNDSVTVSQQPSTFQSTQPSGPVPHHLTDQLKRGVPNMSGYLQKMGT